MFTATLFTVTKTWRQPEGPLISDWIKKMWNAYTRKYYSAIRKDRILPFATTWMDLENIMLSEISETEKADDFTHMWDIKLKATNEQIRPTNKNS